MVPSYAPKIINRGLLKLGREGIIAALGSWPAYATDPPRGIDPFKLMPPHALLLADALDAKAVTAPLANKGTLNTAARFLRKFVAQEPAKTAARPIPIDRRMIGYATQALMRKVKQDLERVEPNRSFAGTFGRSVYEPKGRPDYVAKIIDVRGQEKTIKVHRAWGPGREPVPGADYSPVDDTLWIYFNSVMTKEDVLKYAEDQVEKSLLHEFTHARDVLPAKMNYEQQQTSGPVLITEEEKARAYLNDPAEVKAHMRDLFEQIAPTVREDLAKGRPLGKAVLDALRDNHLWGQMSGLLTRSNFNHVLKGLVTAFEDEMAG